MTCEQYLERQASKTRQSIVESARITGVELNTVVDLPALIRRRPALTLGTGAAAGFVAGSLLGSNTRRATRGAFRSVWNPLLRPTFTALGSVLAEMLIGSSVSSSE